MRGLATLLLLVLLCIYFTLPACEAAADDDELAEQMQNFIDDQAAKGSLTTEEADVLLRMVFVMDPPLVRCFRLNKGKSADKLVKRMKFLLEGSQPQVTASRPSEKPKDDQEARATPAQSIPKQKPLPAPVPAPPSRTVQEEYAHRLRALYNKHNPENVGKVEDFLKRMEGKEHKLYTRVCKKYGVEPEAEYTPRVVEEVNLLEPGPDGTFSEADVSGMFKKLAKMPEHLQQSGVKQLVEKLQQIPALHDHLMSADKTHNFDSFSKLRALHPEKYQEMIRTLPAEQRLMIDVFLQVSEMGKKGAPSAEAVPGSQQSKTKPKDWDSELDGKWEGADSGRAVPDTKLPPLRTSKDVDALFKRMATWDAEKQQQGVAAMVQKFKESPEARQAIKNTGLSDSKDFKMFAQLKRTHPEQYQSVMKTLPAEQRLMLDVFGQVSGNLQSGTMDASHTEL